MFALSTIAADEYVRDVLPHSEPLWGGARTFDEYAGEFRSMAQSAWGRRRFRTVGLRVEGRLVASCKRYARVLRCGERTYEAAGIGAVFTPEHLRGRGYATALLGAFLDAERKAGTDLAFLFSDIAPTFYENLGFVKLPSRAVTLRADALPSNRVAVRTLDDDDEPAIRRTFDALNVRRWFAFSRTPLDWEWQRLLAGSRAHEGQTIRLGVWRGRQLAAYVGGRRVPSADAFVFDEYAFARDADAAAIAPLLRAGAGDLRKVQGWLPPALARGALPRGAVRARTEAVTMLVPISKPFRAAWKAGKDAVLAADADPVWSTDHV